MQRLVLAIIVLAVLVAVLAFALAGLRSVMSPKGASGSRNDDMLQKVAFMILAALMFYVATAGAP